MRAAIYQAFEAPICIETVPDPTPQPHGAVIRVEATGLCRSDWHGWLGHDPDITHFPHVPGHEFAGVVEAVGNNVTRWRAGDRVTVPFICACGNCPQCATGNHQVCDRQTQPGFTHWGSFAEYVAIDHAEVNLVRLPIDMDYITAASLGCRFVTAFRGVVAQGQVKPGQWVAVHGCGGVGLSAIMIANAIGANVIAVDITEEKLDFACTIGVAATVNASEEDVVEAVREISGGGVHVSVDALGSPTTCYNSIANLRKRGKHIQIGLLGEQAPHTPIPMDKVIAYELEILGSHGMQAHQYPEMMSMIRSGALRPQKLIGATISLAQAAEALPQMDRFEGTGITVITEF